MNPKDNIEKFFQKRLQDSSPEEESWNVPSDDLWNKAKVHFPKEEKKKRPFFFFLWGGAVLAVVAIALALYLFNDSEKVTTENQKDIVTVNSELDGNLNQSSVQENVSFTDSMESTILPAQAPAPKEELPPAQVGELPALPQPQENKNISSETKTLLASSKSSQSIPFAETNPKPLKVTNSKEVAHTTLINHDQSPQSSSKNNSEQQLPNISEGDKKTENKIALSSKDMVLSSSVPFENTIALQHLPTLSSSVESDEGLFKTKAALPLIKPQRSYCKWEIGLSFSPFIVNPEWLVDAAESPENETYDLKLKYLNINVPISRRLGRRFSLTSGFSLAQLKLDLGFTALEPYIENGTETELRDIINDNANAGSLSINDESSSDFEITFKPDADLEDGDSILFVGFVPIKLQIIQFPFLLNYHFGKRKLEGLIHIGAGVDYFYGEIPSLELEGFNSNNELVTEPVAFDELTDSGFGFSLYFGAGMKYHFTDRFNVGFSTKLDFTEILLSRHEIGVYYRF